MTAGVGAASSDGAGGQESWVLSLLYHLVAGPGGGLKSGGSLCRAGEEQQINKMVI